MSRDSSTPNQSDSLLQNQDLDSKDAEIGPDEGSHFTSDEGAQRQTRGERHPFQVENSPQLGANQAGEQGLRRKRRLTPATRTNRNNNDGSRSPHSAFFTCWSKREHIPIAMMSLASFTAVTDDVIATLSGTGIDSTLYEGLESYWSLICSLLSIVLAVSSITSTYCIKKKYDLVLKSKDDLDNVHTQELEPGKLYLTAEGEYKVHKLIDECHEGSLFPNSGSDHLSQDLETLKSKLKEWDGDADDDPELCKKILDITSKNHHTPLKVAIKYHPKLWVAALFFSNALTFLGASLIISADTTSTDPSSSNLVTVGSSLIAISTAIFPVFAQLDSAGLDGCFELK